MSGSPRVKSMNLTDPESRPVLGPAGNKARSVELWKPILKTKCENKSPEIMACADLETEKFPYSEKNVSCALSILRRSLSLNASCSSDASSDSTQSRASTGKISRWNSSLTSLPVRRKQRLSPKAVKFGRMEANGKGVGGESEGENVVMNAAVVKKRCAWVTSNTDPSYVAFHDEEWGLPVHNDSKLFELLIFSTALAELTWPAILSKRQMFRDVFLDFDPVTVSKLNEKRIAAPGSLASSLLSEVKLRGVIENARQICKIIGEFGSFDKYIWGFVNYKLIIGNFRYPRQVPIKTSKADTISKDLVRRGFRGVGPTVVYSFMQVAGITNDHLINCFRFQDCVNTGNLRDKNEGTKEKQPEDITELELARDINDLSLSR